MAKVQIKSEKLTPFGGIFMVMEQFAVCLKEVTVTKKRLSVIKMVPFVIKMVPFVIKMEPTVIKIEPTVGRFVSSTWKNGGKGNLSEIMEICKSRRDLYKPRRDLYKPRRDLKVMTCLG